MLRYICLPVLVLTYIYVDADIVCARAKNHYDPDSAQMDLTDSGTQLDAKDAKDQLDEFRAGFKPLHEKIRRMMYFS